jgi:hypothetical protein
MTFYSIKLIIFGENYLRIVDVLNGRKIGNGLNIITTYCRVRDLYFLAAP